VLLQRARPAAPQRRPDRPKRSWKKRAGRACTLILAYVDLMDAGWVPPISGPWTPDPPTRRPPLSVATAPRAPTPGRSDHGAGGAPCPTTTPRERHNRPEGGSVPLLSASVLATLSPSARVGVLARVRTKPDRRLTTRPRFCLTPDYGQRHQRAHSRLTPLGRGLVSLQRAESPSPVS
jgi:hypothetical protein